MHHSSNNKIILVKYPFTDLANSKIRPAVIINESNNNDVFIVPLTSRTEYLSVDEFVLQDWKKAGLNIETAVKRGIYTINSNLILKEIGYLTIRDFEKMKLSILRWLNL